MFRFLIVAIFLMMAGCASLTEYFREPSPMLPNSASLPCCWQMHEKLQIEYQGEQRELASVIAVYDNQLTVVILDSLGRRVFSIIQQGEQIQVEKSDLIKNDLPVEWLLMGVYLRHMPDDGWLFEQSNWTIQYDDRHKLLLQDLRTKVILLESMTHDEAAAQLQYPDLKLNINITTLLKQSLD